MIFTAALAFALVGPARWTEALIGCLTVVGDDAEDAGGDGLAAFVADLPGRFERFSHAPSVGVRRRLRGLNRQPCTWPGL